VNKTFAVIRREFVTRVRTKAFIIGTFLFPVMMVVFMVAPVLLMTGGGKPQRIAIVDATTDDVGIRIEEALSRQTMTQKGAEVPRYNLTRVASSEDRIEAVRDSLVGLTGFTREQLPDGFDGVLVVTSATLVEGRASYFGSNVGSLEAMSRFESAVSSAVRGIRLERAGVSQEVVAQALIPTQLRTTKVEEGKATGESGEAAFILAYAMGFLLYFALIFYGQQTAMSVIEEKSSRIMEVLASSLKPFQMLLGKIIGVGAVGLLQLGIYGAVAFLLSSQRGWIAGLLGVDASAIRAMPMPSFPADLLAVFLAYFVLGFLLYGALFAAIGSMVNSVQEMQSVMTPVTLLMVFGFIGVFAAIGDPTSRMPVILSHVPFFSPMVMPVRWSMSSVPIAELVLSLALLVAGLLACTWVAGRIYRTGILMYGKKPTLREVARWVVR
jgi:ABC-2 type transport system permease protein